MTIEQEEVLIEMVREIRDDFRVMVELMRAQQKSYQTKEEKPQLRWKGQYENTGAMEVPETKNG